MTKIDDGGPAYPQLDVTSCERDGHGDLIDPFTSASGGMSLRDYAAIHAGIPWNAVIETLRLLGNEHPTIGEIVAYRAKVKYVEADAMLAARKAGGE